MDHKFKTKWDNNNNNNSFIFEKDYGYDAISWRQRSFMCNFCKKEYKSAQALGGHMNVHRRDRARLRQSSPSLDHPNPNPNLSSSSSLLSLPLKTFHSSLFSLDHLSSPSNLTMINHQEKQSMLPFVPHSAWNFLGDVRNNQEFVHVQENETRVLKKRERFRVEMESGLDLELRLGRS